MNNSERDTRFILQFSSAMVLCLLLLVGICAVTFGLIRNYKIDRPRIEQMDRFEEIRLRLEAGVSIEELLDHGRTYFHESATRPDPRWSEAEREELLFASTQTGWVLGQRALSDYLRLGNSLPVPISVALLEIATRTLPRDHSRLLPAVEEIRDPLMQYMTRISGTSASLEAIDEAAQTIRRYREVRQRLGLPLEEWTRLESELAGRRASLRMLLGKEEDPHPLPSLETSTSVLSWLNQVNAVFRDLEIEAFARDEGNVLIVYGPQARRAGQALAGHRRFIARARESGLHTALIEHAGGVDTLWVTSH